MDLDRGLLAAVIREQDFSAFQKISLEMIQGDSVAAYRFVEAYYLQYQKIPSYDLILNQTNIDLIQGINLREPSDFFVDKIKERYFWFKARDGAQSLVAALERQDSIQNIKAILTRMLHQELYDASSSDSLPRSIFNNGDEILREYERAKLEGLTGVPTPWPTVNRMTMGWQPEDFTLFVSRPGSGKCLARGTKVIMFDGSVRNVEDIKVGDQLMGPDSKPRNVLSTNTGREMMYEIIPTKGESWICNESHILSLKISSTFSKKYKAGDVVNISVKDYLQRNTKFKQQARLWRTGVEFPERNLPVEPYMVGIWLGDGTRSEPVITNPDIEIENYIKEFALRHGFDVVNESRNNGDCNTWRLSNKWKGNFLRKFFKNHCVIGDEKTIPRDYLINSRENRLQILAGLIDTDGYLSKKSYEITTKFERLRDDILFLSRSLGFAAYYSERRVSLGDNCYGKYWRIIISGETSLIPVKIARKKSEPRKHKKNVLVTGFNVKKLDEGDYYGFTLDGDHLFLLGDFTVTHNTWLLISILLHAWECGYKVMLFSTEMKVLALKRRVMALLTKLSYSLIKAGRLSAAEFEYFRETLQSFSSDDRFLVVGNDTTLKRSIIEQNIAMGKPDLVGIDGYYMVEDDMEKHQKDDRGAIWKVGKKIAKKYQVPLLVTHQLNRKPQHEKPGQKPTLDRLAHSDAAGMYADFVFSIWQTEEMFNDKRLGINPMKTRDSELKDAIEIRWDLTNGNFTEIDRNAVTSETSQVVDYTQPQEISDIPF